MLPRDSSQSTPLNLPQDSWQKAWGTAVGLAVEALNEGDFGARCALSGANWKADEGVAELLFLGRLYQVRPPEFDVVLVAEGEEAPIREKILLLHYLQTASGAAPAGEWIAFEQVPSGELYLGNFKARSVDRLARAFGGREEMLVEVAGEIGGNRAEHGDVSVELRPLPQVPVLLVLWRGDDEFPAAGNLLFDARVTEYLPLEDMVVLAEMVATRLCASLPR